MLRPTPSLAAAAARAAAVDLAAGKAASHCTQQRARGTITMGVHGAADQRAANGTYDQTGRAIGLAAIAAAVTTAPFAIGAAAALIDCVGGTLVRIERRKGRGY